ncbi:MAG TPA: hypothetical protein DCL15_22290 [Chloroflexi bacterium]|nr:hypothetical protein [Chloroflexota bacterium]HHW85470.1 DUF1440 domain-containing protein [Chloroflexota bacterium]
MTTAVSTQTQNPSLAKSIVAGAIAGLGGGVVFGMMMAMMGMLPMVAMLAGSQDPLIGFIVHMAISAFIGAVYGVVAGRLPQSALTGIIAGAVNGVVWWVLGALIAMPLMLGMSNMVLQIGEAQWMSLVGHVIYGVVAGLLFIPLARRS